MRLDWKSKIRGCSRWRALLLLLGGTVWILGAAPAGASPPNVLFIAVDDLNDWIGVLGGHPQVRTPNIDRLAARGMTFENAHAATPACNPSRTAVLTGIHPTTSGVYLNGHDWRAALPDAVTLPEHFKANGYHVMGAGKIFHGNGDARSWHEYYQSIEKPRPIDPKPKVRPVNQISMALKFDWGPLAVDDAEMGDAKVVSWVIDQLARPREGPFFLAAGLFRPHLPWYVPQAYFDAHPLEAVQLPPVLVDDLADVPPAGVAMADAPRSEHSSVLAKGQWKAGVQGYLASIAFADVQVGRLLDALDASPSANDTIVILWSDHGWHLGEKQHWRKFTLWERATRSPLIVVAPGLTEPGSRSSRPVGLLDIYPTLVDLTGLPLTSQLEGRSLRPLLANAAAPWDRPVLTTQGRGNHAVRSERYRYIRYADGSEEVYDHATDPHEWTNLAGDPALDTVKRELAAWIPDQQAMSQPLPWLRRIPFLRTLIRYLQSIYRWVFE